MKSKLMWVLGAVVVYEVVGYLWNSGYIGSTNAFVFPYVIGSANQS